MKNILKYLVYGSVFAVPFMLLWVPSSMFFPFITGKNFAFRILVEIATAAWLLLALCDRSYRPRWSFLVPAIVSLVGIMLVADIFGEYAPKSIWSNYERMEGWVTLLHFSLYFLIVGIILNTEKLWKYFFNTALVAAGIMSLYALAQVAGVTTVSQGSAWRVYAQLGNSSYLAVYMLFHMFIAAWLFIRVEDKKWRWLYGGLFALFTYILLHTGTRGTALGLVGGFTLSFIYLAIMAPKGATIKKWALGGVLGVVLTVGGLVAARQSDFVQNSAMLQRFANISYDQGSIRFTVWRMAWEGFKERPILGWGQENFNYVFNKYYEPSLYSAESWYDRTHNIFMDWLITGGVLGLLAYLSILGGALWYSVLKQFWARLREKAVDSNFTVYEQALLFGLLAAYMFHNLFVFDNLASWIFYAVVLALIHYRVAGEWPVFQKWPEISSDVFNKVAAPLVLVAMVFTIYVVNVPGLKAAQYIIDSYQAPSVAERMQYLENALHGGTFADQEVVEQMVQVGNKILANQNISAADRTLVEKTVRDALEYINNKKSGDARLHVIGASFYLIAQDFEQALSELKIAEALSPQKQAIISEESLVYIMLGQDDKAIATAKRSYAIDTSNQDALLAHAATLIASKDPEALAEVINEDKLQADPDLRNRFIRNPFILRAAYFAKDYRWLLYVAKGQIEFEPENPDKRVNLAAIYIDMGDTQKAKETLIQAAKDIPSFKAKADALLKQI